MKKVFILSVLSSLALITWAGQVEAVTVKLLPNDTRVRPVGWQSGTILFKMGQITIDDFDGGVKIGTLAVDTHLKIWNSTTSICFAGNTVIEFERAGGVLRGFICSETRMRIVYSSTWISFAKLSPVTFGYDSGVVSGVIAYDMDLPDAKGIARRYKANTMVNFNVKGQVESSMPWNGNITSSSGSPVGSWHNTINNRVSTWTITATADGTYFAQESGLGSAKGPAYFTQSGTFRIDYTFSGGSGFYEVRFSPDYNSAKGFCVDPSSTCTWVRINQ
ncbi:MAG: hypothetical protein JXQ27_06585 [Acidobacteria bacterium]|nr:hypothetical protein [Acidobacteriota bacterium]